MAGSSGQRGKPGPDNPDYQWLYGENADQTRRLPRQPARPPATGAARPSATGKARPSSAGKARPQPGPRRPPARRTRGRALRRWTLVLLLLWVTWLVAVPLFAWSQVPKVPFEPLGTRPAGQPGTTYLLVGSDSRAGLTAKQRRELGTGNAAGQRTDTIMLLHTGSGPNLLMSIPRDSLVEIPDRGTTKINAAFAYGGPQLLVRTLEQNTGIRIDQYVEIGFAGVVDVVDAVGGIEICPTQDMVDPLAKLDIRKGCQVVDGKTALAYSRSRHTDARYGDIGRAAHQREVVSAVGQGVLSVWTVLNPVRYWRMNMAAPVSFAFGSGTNPVRAVLWATAMTRVDGDHGLTCGVPIRDLEVHWDPERAGRMFRHISQDTTALIPDGLCTPTGLPS